jgi:Sigma-54 interaction domain
LSLLARGRRDEFVDPYFRGAGPDQVIVILKAREPARIMTVIGDKKLNRRHLQIADRWIVQYNFYISDRYWGRRFVRMCPYLRFSARVCVNQHHWLANRMREEGIDFQQCSNAFLRCGAPERLQQLADTLTAEDLASCGRKWLTRRTPFVTETERKQAGCQHRLFFSQIEFCDNLIFHRRAALDKLGERLLDANRTIGQPNKITVIFGRKVTKQYRGKLQTEIEDMNLPNPVIRSHYRNGFITQYVRDHVILRTEPASNNLTDYGVNKAIEHLPALRDKMAKTGSFRREFAPTPQLGSFMSPHEPQGAFGNSEAMRHVELLLRQVADSDSSLLITGDSGVGKEVAAKFVHQISTRADEPFIAYNCTALPNDLIESQLFGFEWGALHEYPGASSRLC